MNDKLTQFIKNNADKVVPFLKNNAGKLVLLVLVVAALAWFAKKILNPK